MNKNIVSTIVSLMASLFFITSCEDIIDVDLRTADPQLVIEGVVRMDALAEVRITKSKAFSGSNEYDPVKDAVVVIRDDAGNTETLPYDPSGKYMAATIKGVERRAYYLTVTCEGEEYTATTVMPPVVAIDSLTLWEFPVVDFPSPMVHFRDPKGEENQYYRYVFAINHEYPKFRESLISTEFMDGNVIHQPLFLRYEDDRDDDPIQQNDLITVEMRCLDKGTFTFFETLSRVEESLANPTSNIIGGALGYFGAYSFSSMDIVAKWEE